MSEDQVVKYDEMGVMDGGTVGLGRPMNRDIWLKEVFPEWGTFLNYEIEHFEVKGKKGVCWYLGGPSYAIKSRQGAVFTVDLYAGPSLFTDRSYCGVCKQSGAEKIHWMRINPHVIDPWKFKRWDAVFITHQHQDHMDFYTIQAALQTSHAKFVAPPKAAYLMKTKMGVPEDRIIVAEWGKSIKFEDMEVVFAPNFDVTVIHTGVDTPMPFKECTVTYIFKTEGGNFAFLGDTHYHNGYKMVGDEHEIDMMTVNMGNNAPGYTDKASPWDLWRMAEALNAKVVIPMHWDNWANCYEEPDLLEYIIAKKSRGKIKTVVLHPGARYVHPDDQDIGRYMYPDWRERFDWKKSWQYGYGDPANPKGLF
jgi:L-ascorbate 6-phosphate lactonase